MEKLKTENLNLYYSDFHALKNINISVTDRSITAIIGPSGCGKSTLLRCFNRMNDYIEGVKITGSVFVNGINIYGNGIALTQLRRNVGMVFQRPNPFPLNIYENIAFGLRIHRLVDSRREIDDIVEKSLRDVGLWEDLKDKLKRPALELSLEQQQRLCIARVIAVRSDIILLDEPCSALDPIATQKIEELLQELKKEYTIIIVTHNIQQAARVSDYTGFMLLGELLEFNRTSRIFTNPQRKETEEYITGKFG